MGEGKEDFESEEELDGVGMEGDDVEGGWGKLLLLMEEKLEKWVWFELKCLGAGAWDGVEGCELRGLKGDDGDACGVKGEIIG